MPLDMVLRDPRRATEVWLARTAMSLTIKRLNGEQVEQQRPLAPRRSAPVTVAEARRRSTVRCESRTVVRRKGGHHVGDRAGAAAGNRGAGQMAGLPAERYAHISITDARLCMTRDRIALDEANMRGEHPWTVQ